MFKTHRTFSLETGVKNNSIAVIKYGQENEPNWLIDVIYHKTIVVSKRGRVVTLRNGGWDTISTRAVINRALEQIASSVTFLHRVKGQTMLTQNGITKPFTDGMSIKVRG